jgi:hypothetical protein
MGMAIDTVPQAIRPIAVLLTGIKSFWTGAEWEVVEAHVTTTSTKLQSNMTSAHAGIMQFMGIKSLGAARQT